jgi:hypothetical protein
MIGTKAGKLDVGAALAAYINIPTLGKRGDTGRRIVETAAPLSGADWSPGRNFAIRISGC